MANNWEFPDVDGYLSSRENIGELSLPMTPNEAGWDESTYVIDPDYADRLGLDWSDSFIRYKK